MTGVWWKPAQTQWIVPEARTGRQEVLEDAQQKVLHDRNQNYGDPSADFKRAAKIISVILEKKLVGSVEPHEVALILDAVKTSRLVESPDHLDSWIDKAGYAACGREASGD